MTNYYKLSDLNQQEFILAVLEARSVESKC